MDIAVQIRHWKSPISKRAVDELRGILLRDNLSAGMIVATSECSKAAKIAAADFNGRPIRILGLSRFADSMVELGIGVRVGRFDERFFRTLDSLTLGHRRSPIARLPRPAVLDFHNSPEEELVAELASAFVCAELGLDNSLIQSSSSYINGWLDVLKRDNRAVIAASSQARNAADYILGRFQLP